MRQPLPRPHTPQMPRDFAEVINLWRSATELAIALDVEAVTVRAWRRRGIPARHWAGVAAAARMTGKPVDERLLTELGSIGRSRTISDASADRSANLGKAKMVLAKGGPQHG
jgi:hypothetical protein